MAHQPRTATLDRFMSRLIDFEPEGDDGGGGGGGGGGTEGNGDKTFTQADVDRIVQERLARDRKERPSDDEIKELRDKAKKYDDLEAQSKSELERERERAEKAEKEAEAARAEAKETRLKSAILAEAGKADRKVVDPEAILSLIDKKSLTLDDSGAPTNITEVMDALLEAKPYLVSTGSTTTTRTGAADQGARGGDGGKEQLASTDGMSADEIAEAVADGRLDTYLSTPK
jgi:hypothetical protein